MSYATLQGLGFGLHTLRIEQATWSNRNSPMCDICDSGDIQDEKQVLFRCSNYQAGSLRQQYASLFEHNFSFLYHHTSHRMPCQGIIHHVTSQDIKNLQSQDNNRLPFFFMILCAFMNRLVVEPLGWGLFSLVALITLSALLTKIVHADIALGASYRKSWIAFIEACEGLHAADT